MRVRALQGRLRCIILCCRAERFDDAHLFLGKGSFPRLSWLFPPVDLAPTEPDVDLGFLLRALDAYRRSYWADGS